METYTVDFMDQSANLAVKKNLRDYTVDDGEYRRFIFQAYRNIINTSLGSATIFIDSGQSTSTTAKTKSSVSLPKIFV